MVFRETASAALLLIAVGCADPGAPSSFGSEGSSSESGDEQQVYIIDLDPDLDFTRSPHTGWTREHYEALFGRMCRSLVRYLQPRAARVKYPGTAGNSEAEGVARMLPLISAWLSEPDNPDVIEVDGETIDLVAVARDAVLAMSDPDHRDYWGAIPQGDDQRAVEAAFISASLVRSRDRVWDQLDVAEQDAIMDWLVPATQPVYANNWLALLAVRNGARRALDYPADASATDELLDAVDSLYAGDGWYRDGAESAFDWYNAFVFQPELLLWAEFDGERDPARRSRITSRARAFLHHFPYFFADDGRPVAWGRSLAYRTALLAPLMIAQRQGLNPLSPGLSRRLSSGVLRFHSEAMFDDNDVLTVGYVGPNENVAEAYIRVGAVYLAARGLLALALPRDDPFWTATEESSPSDLGAFEHVVPAIGASLVGGGPDHSVTLFNGGIDGIHQAKHDKLTYSSHFYFGAARVEGSFGYDGTLSLSADGERLGDRDALLDAAAARGFAYARYATNGDAELGVAVVADADRQLRIACADTQVAGATLFDGGYAVPSEPAFELGDDWVYARSSAGSVLSAAVLGFDGVSAPAGFAGRDDLNIVHERAVQAFLSAPADTQRCVASVQLARRLDFDPDAERTELIEFIAAADRDEFEARFASGAVVFASLDPSPIDQSVVLGAALVDGPVRFARGQATSFDGSGVARWDSGTGVEFIADAPASAVHIELGAAELTVQSDVAWELRGVSATEVHGVGLGGALVELTDQADIDASSVRIDGTTHRALADDLDLSASTFIVRL